jgi:peroxiredoxin
MKIARIALLIILAVAAFGYFDILGLYQTHADEFLGNQAPDFTLSSYHGDAVSLTDLVGKVILLTFWFPECSACQSELPRLQKLWNDYHNSGLEIIAIEATGNRGAALSFIKNNGLTYYFLENGKSSEEIVISKYNVHRYPTTLILDREGIIREYFVGFVPGKEKVFEEKIKSLLNE